MKVLGLILCTLSAYLLAATPLSSLTTAVAAVSALVLVGSTAVSMRGGTPPRWLTALGHTALAMAVFFLFVWWQLPQPAANADPVDRTGDRNGGNALSQPAVQ